MEKRDETGDGDVVNISQEARRWEEDDGRWEWDGLGVGSESVCVRLCAHI